jgi:hypothetical protein
MSLPFKAMADLEREPAGGRRIWKVRAQSAVCCVAQLIRFEQVAL